MRDGSGPAVRRAIMRQVAPALALLLLAACGEGDTAETKHLVQGERSDGKRLIGEFNCGVCHSIPGVRGARGVVGPPLGGFGRRSYVAGVLPNRPELLMRWIRNAPEIAPRTAMPGFPTMTERQALDIATYLYTLDSY